MQGNSTPQWLDFHSAANCCEHATVMDTSVPPSPVPPSTTAHTPAPTGVTQGQGEITHVEMNENVTVGLCF